MSAYVVTKNTVNFIVSAMVGLNRSEGNLHIKITPYLSRELQGSPDCVKVEGQFLVFDFGNREVCRYVAEVLWQENIRSVKARYKGDTDDYGDCPFLLNPNASFNAHLMDAISCCDCLEYQSCETEDYEDTIAYAILKKIKARLVQKHLNNHGYREAKWGIK